MVGKATCRTCGAELPGPHKPSVFDPLGKGNPGHKMDNPGLSSYDEDYYLKLEGKEKSIKKVIWQREECEVVEETESLYAIEVKYNYLTMSGRSITWVRKEWVELVEKKKEEKHE